MYQANELPQQRLLKDDRGVDGGFGKGDDDAAGRKRGEDKGEAEQQNKQYEALLKWKALGISEISITVNTIIISLLLFVCSVYLIQQSKNNTFVSVLTGLDLAFLSLGIGVVEFYQPPGFLDLVAPFWQNLCARGLFLSFLSLVGSEGLSLTGLPAFVLSLGLVTAHFLGAKAPRAILQQL